MLTLLYICLIFSSCLSIVFRRVASNCVLSLSLSLSQVVLNRQLSNPFCLSPSPARGNCILPSCVSNSNPLKVMRVHIFELLCPSRRGKRFIRKYEKSREREIGREREREREFNCNTHVARGEISLLFSVSLSSSF